MSESRSRGGIGEVIGRHIHGLHGSYRTLFGRRNTLLQLSHFGSEIGLVSDSGRHAAQQRRDFRTGLSEAKDVVNEQERVCALFVAEIFGNCKSGERDAQTGSGRFGHLAIDQCGFGILVIAGLDHA